MGHAPRRPLQAVDKAWFTASLWAMAPDFRLSFLREHARPLPIIGDSRAPAQGGAHDDAPLVSAAGRPQRVRALVRPLAASGGVFFERGRVSVDSGTLGPKPLCHRHRSG